MTTETTEDAVTRRLEDSAMACIGRGIAYWWPHAHEDGMGGLECYALRQADDHDDSSAVLGSVPVADWDAAMAEATARNLTLVREGE